MNGSTVVIVLVAVVTVAQLPLISGKFINFEDLGGIPDEISDDVAFSNGKLFNDTINLLEPFDTFFLPNKTFYMLGGIKAEGLSDNTFIIDGTILFTNDRDSWPKQEDGSVEECIYLTNIENILFTSMGSTAETEHLLESGYFPDPRDDPNFDQHAVRGTFDGNGKAWWGAIPYLKYHTDRPRLMRISHSKNVTVEYLLFKDSPRWTFYADHSDGLLIRFADVSARWTNQEKHTLIDLQAFNTDGWDVTGRNVYIHDSFIWNQDDCISVKDDAQDMLFERITCSGLGLVIGSIGRSVVRNITFRDSYLPNTVKGIYLKNRWSDSGPVSLEEASITDILYENIVMDKPEQYAIWIGPAQQNGQPCSLLWTKTPGATCDMSGYQIWENIVLRNITINDPVNSPGVLMGNSTYPMRKVVFDNVVVNGADPKSEPWGEDYYYCEGMEAYATGGTFPVPPCFKTV